MPGRVASRSLCVVVGVAVGAAVRAGVSSDPADPERRRVRRAPSQAVGSVDSETEEMRMGNSFPIGNTVTAVARTPDHLDLFAVGPDGGVQTTWWDTSEGWADWFPIAQAGCSPTNDAVTAVARTPAHPDLLAVGPVGEVQTTWLEPNGGWDNWFSIVEVC